LVNEIILYYDARSKKHQITEGNNLDLFSYESKIVRRPDDLSVIVSTVVCCGTSLLGGTGIVVF
jgi:hypothetical protein